MCSSLSVIKDDETGESFPQNSLIPGILGDTEEGLLTC